MSASSRGSSVRPTVYSRSVDEEERFGVIRMRGGRYEQPGLPLVGAAELRRYEQLVQRVARSLFMREHPKRKRAPRNFGQSISLRLTAIEEGCVIPVLSRTSSGEDTLFRSGDYLEDARRLINDALRGFNSESQQLDRKFPVDCLQELASFGRSFTKDEFVEFSDNGENAAIFDIGVRQRIQQVSRLESLEVELLLHGQVTGLRSDPQRFDFLTGERKLTGSYLDPATWSELHAFEGFAERAPMVALSVVAQQARSGEIVQIQDVLGIEAALPPEWASRLETLSQLRAGWLTPDSPPPDARSIDLAEQLLLACVDEGIGRPGIFPTPEGGVLLEWSLANVEIDIEFPPNKNFAEASWFQEDETGEGSKEIDSENIDALVDFVREAWV